MSYILDALRKAQAQRERSRLPGLYDQPLGTTTAGVRGGAARVVGAAAAGVGIVAVAALAWKLSDGSDVGGAPPAADSKSARAEAPAAAPPASRPALPAPAPAAAAPPAPAPAAAETILPPAPATVEAPRPARGVPAAAAASVPAGAASQPAAITAKAAQGAASAAVPTGPPAGSPPLAVTGGVYSQNPAQRMLIVNGQVFNEGSEVAAGVTLEEVRPKQAVLNFRGQRFAMPY